MTMTVRMALRDWDWLTPLLLGETDRRALDRHGVELDIHRVPALVDLSSGTDFEVAETSLSRYAQHIAAGATDVTALPHWMMQSFRHRCIIVSRQSSAHAVRDLRGGAIGLTGWQDSGNTWTRAVLAESGVGIDDARWVVGRLTAHHPVQDRLAGFGRPGHIEADPRERPLMEMLSAGELDAVLTPFMPTGFFASDSLWRPLLDDLAGAEAAYADRHNFVPGIHVLGFRSDFLRSHQEIAVEISAALVESRRIWTEKRRRYAETSMWIIDDLLRESRVLPAGWDQPGLDRQGEMVAAFSEQLERQRLLPAAPAVSDLFPIDIPAAYDARPTFAHR
ncbi:substrate-binding domain-containing protein [Microlunatus soli]|uniref:4,5-dihydroxyphthalate decarboxylase n=1 Tax=Microlunatus soli TaxID=630515 RepID=A0A1H1ZYU4_9ACTN|nr:hypothetical protein [Microlunatus soli]SDT38416.1 4,5-dihydroxyphthalate decarboxylase [Microlunatus soli]